MVNKPDLHAVLGNGQTGIIVRNVSERNLRRLDRFTGCAHDLLSMSPRRPLESTESHAVLKLWDPPASGA